MVDPASGAKLAGGVLGLAGKAVSKDRTWRLRLVWLVRKSANYPVPTFRLWRVLRRYKKPFLLERALKELSRTTNELRLALSDAGAWAEVEDSEVTRRCLRLVELLTEWLPEAVAAEQVSRIAGERIERRLETQDDQLTTLVDNLNVRALDPSVAEQLPPYLFADLNALVRRLGPAQSLVDALLLPDPGATLKTWAAHPPAWLNQAGAEGWVMFGRALSAHKLPGETCEAWRRALEEGAVPAPYWQAQRALILAAEDKEGALDALPVDAATSTDPLVRGVHAVLEDRPQDALAAFRAWTPQEPRETEQQTLLQAGELVKLDRLDEAIRLLEQAPPTSRTAALPLVTARLLLNRAQNRLSVNRAEDLRRAADAATLARDRRRNWRGDSVEAVTVLADALIAGGDMQAAWAAVRPAPEGKAIQAEADDARLLPAAAMAAAATGHVRVAEQIADQLAPLHAAWVRALVLKGRRPAGDAGEAAHREWQGDLDAAWRRLGAAASTDDELLSAGQAAAAHGVFLDQLEPLRERYPTEVAQCAGLARAANDPVLLRALCTTSLPAAMRLSELLEQEGDNEGAARTLVAAADRFRDDTLRLMAVDQLLLAGLQEQAAEQARTVLLGTPQSGLRQRALYVLLDMAQQRGDWPDMEAHARALLAIPGTGDEVRWGLAAALANQSRSQQAWEALCGIDGPPRPTTLNAAVLLISLQQRHARASELVRSGLDVLRQFGDDEQFAAYVIHAMISGGVDRHDPSGLSAEDRAELQEAMQTFFGRFPDSAHLRLMDASDPEAFMAQVSEMMRPRAEMIAEIDRQVADGQLPLGVLAAAVRKTYTEIVVLGAGGLLRIRALDEDEQRAERAALRTHASSRVVADASAIRTLTLLQPAVQAPALGLHSAIVVLDPVLRDITAGRDALALRATGAFVYDPDLGHAVLSESTQDQADQAADRSAAMVELALRQTREPWPEILELVNLDDEGLMPWLSPIDAAKNQGLMLYSDDAVQRRFARQVGVQAFGTLTLLDFLTEKGHLTLSERQDGLDELLWNGAVDLPFDSHRWRRIAERDGWQPKAAAMQLSRPHAWSNPVESIRLLDEALKRSEDVQGALGNWIAAALLGLMRATIPARRAESLGAILARLWIRHSDDPARFPIVLEAARWAAHRADVADPLPSATLLVHSVLAREAGEAPAAAYVLRLAKDAAESDRQIILETIFQRPSGDSANPTGDAG